MRFEGFLMSILRRIGEAHRRAGLTSRYDVRFMIVDWHQRAFQLPAAKVAANTKVVAMELLRMLTL